MSKEDILRWVFAIPIPVAVTLITYLLKDIIFNERKNRAIIKKSSVQLWNSYIDRKNIELVDSESKPYFIISLINKDVEDGGGIRINVTELTEKELDSRNTRGYKLLRLVNISKYPASLRAIQYKYAGCANYDFHREERYYIKPNDTISLLVEEKDCPDKISINYPNYILSFDELRKSDLHIMIPTIKKA